MTNLDRILSGQHLVNIGNCKEEFMAKLEDKPLEDKTTADMVNHPHHYNKTNRECIDVIQDSLTKDEFIGYLKGTIIKYTYRYPDKNGQEDLEKAVWFINKLRNQEGSDETGTTE